MNQVTISTQVLDALHNLSHAYRREMRKALQALEPTLTDGDLRVLLFLGYQPDSTHKKLMEHMRTDKAQLTRMLRELESKGWIVRTPHPEDGRSRQLQLSERGAELFSALRQRRAKIGSAMLCGVSIEKQLQFLDLLKLMEEQAA
ncbi:MarR family transcriptional regulator [Diaphorobacter sp.]|uniref:MarR family winged helix-turn-helix transcriptional regulator n=1 Tax=Diaphorobacter sp. TaxID=1934310 RepID=UPI0028AD60DB|nr:MarR family transcriptional regulator [Diaphorobacter sp.]